MTNIVLLATAWGPRYGGINAFNMDLALALADLLGKSGQVVCAVLDASRHEINEARKADVTLLSLRRRPDAPEFDTNWAYDVGKELRKLGNEIRIDWWVGHDVSSGGAALEGRSVVGGSRSALIMHMNYADY
jgi:hypothetical protein